MRHSARSPSGRRKLQLGKLRVPPSPSKLESASLWLQSIVLEAGGGGGNGGRGGGEGQPWCCSAARAASSCVERKEAAADAQDAGRASGSANGSLAWAPGPSWEDAAAISNSEIVNDASSSETDATCTCCARQAMVRSWARSSEASVSPSIPIRETMRASSAEMVVLKLSGSTRAWLGCCSIRRNEIVTFAPRPTALMLTPDASASASFACGSSAEILFSSSNPAT
eukprot:558076-Pleurochrysis_carterae.AAC.2